MEDKAIRRYRKRRQERLDERLGVEPDIVQEFKARRSERLQSRFDASARLGYGIAKGLGIDTTDMSPREVWEAIKEKDPDSYAAAHSGGKRSKREQEVSKRSGFVNGWRPPKVSGMDEADVHVTLSKCNKIGGGHYNKAKDVANEDKNTYLWTFTSHGMDHVQQVIEKTNQAADEIDKMPEDSIFKGTKIDRPLMLVSAWFHDTGMDGDDMDWSNDNGDGIRDLHGMNSALHILRHAKEIEKLGVDPNKVALTAFAHTKSKSGIDDLTDPNDWRDALDRLGNAAKEQGIKFDRKSVFDGEPTSDNIHQMMAQVAALRLGDANREAKGNDLYSQSGGKYDIDVHPDMNKVAERIKARREKEGEAFKGREWEEEVAEAKISIKDKDGSHELNDDDPKMKKVAGHKFSARVVLGERNMEEVNSRFNKKYGTIQEDITLVNGNDVPWSTTEALLERCGELNTINKVPRALCVYMTGVKNESEMSETAKEAFDKMWLRIRMDKDKKTQLPKYDGVDDVILVFDDGEPKRYGKRNNGGNDNEA